MAFSLNDIISRSEKKSREPMSAKTEVMPEPKVALNVVTVEEQQRRVETVSRPLTETKMPSTTPRRTYQVKTRLSEEEKQFFDQRVRTSGLN